MPQQLSAKFPLPPAKPLPINRSPARYGEMFLFRTRTCLERAHVVVEKMIGGSSFCGARTCVVGPSQMLVEGLVFEPFSQDSAERRLCPVEELMFFAWAEVAAHERGAALGGGL